jgi:hypothetical protein
VQHVNKIVGDSPPYFQKVYNPLFGEVADKSTVIDPQTAEHIELMTCLGDKKSKLSLFGVMNHCVTKGEDQKPSRLRLRHIFRLFRPVPEIIDHVFAKTSQNARFL